MYSNYKNFERARYLLIRDFLKQKEISEIKMKYSEGTLFSGIFSAIISYVINNTLSPDMTGEFYLKVVQRCLLISSFYVLSFVVLKALYNLVLLIADGIRVHKKRDSLSVYEGYIKDFDNIACDSIIMVLGYKQNISTIPISQVLIKQFNLYEMVHYLELAFTITQRLVNKKDECINFGDMANNKGVDGYRVKNMILLIEQLSEDVLSIYNSINIMDELLESRIITVKTESPKLLASIKR